MLPRLLAVLFVACALHDTVASIDLVADDLDVLADAVSCVDNKTKAEFIACVQGGSEAAVIGEQVNANPLECSAIQSLAVLVSACARVTDGCEVNCDEVNAKGKELNANCEKVDCPPTKGGVVAMLLTVGLGLTGLVWITAALINSSRRPKQMRFAQ